MLNQFDIASGGPRRDRADQLRENIDRGKYSLSVGADAVSSSARTERGQTVAINVTATSSGKNLFDIIFNLLLFLSLYSDV